MHTRLLRVLFAVVLLSSVSVFWSAPASAAAGASKTSPTPSSLNVPKPHSGTGIAMPHLVNTSTTPQTTSHGPSQSYHHLPAPPSYGPTPPVPHSGAVRLPTPSSIQPNTSFVTGFSGIGYTGIDKPDANAAIGATDIVEVVNSQINAYSLGGTIETQMTLNSLFNVTGALFDPHVVYDYASSRYIVLVDNNFTGLLIAVSQQSTGNGVWCTYSIPTSNNADFPLLGVSPQGIFFSANLFANTTNPSSFITSEVFAAFGTNMESCKRAPYSFWTNLHDGSGALSFSIVPVVATLPFVDHTVAEYLVDSSPSGGCNLYKWAIDLKTKTLNLKDSVSVPCYSPPTPAPQFGSSVKVDTFDNELSQALYEDWVGTCVPTAGYGAIDTSMTSGYDWGDGNGTVAVMNWYRIDVTNTFDNGLLYDGSLGSPGWWDFLPAFSMSASGGIIIYDASSSSADPTLRYVGLTWGPNCGGVLASGDTLLVLGQAYYDIHDSTHPNAYWGDFQTAWVDPNAPHVVVWICGEYAAGNDTWGTEIAEVNPT